MRIVGLIVVLAIIYYAYSKRFGPDSKKENSAMSEYEQTVNPTGKTPSAPPAVSGNSSNSGGASSNVRRPIDTTRSVLEQVKKRNGDGEF